MCALISITQEPDNILRIDGLGRELVDNDALVKEVTETITALIDNEGLISGEIIKVYGPLSVPIAFVLAHKLSPLFKTVAVYDPRLKNKYVVTIVNGGEYSVGDLVD